MNNKIHPTAIIESNVKIGSNNYIGPFCYITGDTIIGDNNRFEAYCSIGTSAEHRDYFNTTDGKTVIGNNNVLREFTTVNAGTKSPTILHNNIVMLRNSHVGHDSIVEDLVNLSCNTLIGGHSYLMTGCNFGLGSICHQFSVIGAFSMIGMGSIITKSSKIIPGNVYVGSPVKLLKQNIVGLERNNIDESKLNKLIEKYNTLCQK
jgi:UDP-N-acetylglucosamine acyltransferase